MSNLSRILSTVCSSGKNVFKAHVAVLTVFAFVLHGCSTLESKYPGYKVVNKEARAVTEKVAIRVTSCVTPEGRVICERRYGAFNDCSLMCKTPQNSWIERPEGYGGYENVVVTRFFLKLQSPSGMVETTEVGEKQYHQTSIGQVLTDEMKSQSNAATSDIERQQAGGATDAATIPSSNSPSSSKRQDSDKEKLSIRDVQRKLKELGFNPGTADGALGPKTIQALKLFQQKRNIPITGSIDERTIELLK